MQEQMAILDTHNMERENHGVASLYWDYSASDFAGGHLSSCPGAITLQVADAERCICQRSCIRVFPRRITHAALIAEPLRVRLI